MYTLMHTPIYTLIYTKPGKEYVGSMLDVCLYVYIYTRESQTITTSYP